MLALQCLGYGCRTTGFCALPPLPLISDPQVMFVLGKLKQGLGGNYGPLVSHAN